MRCIVKDAAGRFEQKRSVEAIPWGAGGGLAVKVEEDKW